MRIITGTLRGRRLKSPKNYDIRPTSDKVKEAIFDMLLPYLEEGCVCMDVFAGSGNMGLEAVSRGAEKVFFSDSSRESLALVRDNIEICGVKDNCILLSGDFRQNIARVHQTVNIYFLDPPYAAQYILPALDAIAESGNLADDGVVVCEYSHKDVLPEEYGCFRAVRVRTYGAIGVTIYEKRVDN